MTVSLILLSLFRWIGMVSVIHAARWLPPLTERNPCLLARAGLWAGQQAACGTWVDILALRAAWVTIMDVFVGVHPTWVSIAVILAFRGTLISLRIFLNHHCFVFFPVHWSVTKSSSSTFMQSVSRTVSTGDWMLLGHTLVTWRRSGRRLMLEAKCSQPSRHAVSPPPAVLYVIAFKESMYPARAVVFCRVLFMRNSSEILL